MNLQRNDKVRLLANRLTRQHDGVIKKGTIGRVSNVGRSTVMVVFGGVILRLHRRHIEKVSTGDKVSLTNEARVLLRRINEAVTAWPLGQPRKQEHEDELAQMVDRLSVITTQLGAIREEDDDEAATD
jgi:hypothetical protein